MNVPERIRVRTMTTYNEEAYKVRRGNVSLRVSKNEVAKYFDMGYDVYSLDGALVKKAVPKDIATLQKAFTDDQAEIARLKAEIVELKSQLQQKSAAPAAAKKTSTTKKVSKA